MKKVLFNILYIVSIGLSIIGIYSLETDKEIFSFLNIHTIGIFLTIGFFQTYYIYIKKRRRNPQYAKVSKEKEKTYKKVTKPSVRLSDVAGLDEVKEEIMEIVDFISNSNKYKEVGAVVPKGVLFYGPPGTGKTLLASALAGETNSSFLYSSGSEFIEKYVGVGAKRIRELFEQARKEAPSIIFIDEIDAIGGKRTEDGQSEGNQTINQLLTEMDGFKEEDEALVIVIGATNRLDILDSALLRPGRFDKHIYIGNPNRYAREEILKVHTRNKPLSKDVDLNSIALRTHGLSGAHLSNIANEAAILAVRNNRKIITKEDFNNAIERIIAGLRMKNTTISKEEKKVISFHEAGHALVGRLLNAHKIEKISIVPTGKALGYVINSEGDDKYLYTKRDLVNKISSILGGRAAEEIVFGEVTTGAEDDLSKATDLVMAMVCKYGMSSFGNRSFNSSMIQGNMGLINKEVNNIINKIYNDTKKLLNENKEILTKIANRLYEEETITGDEVEKLLNNIKISITS